MILRLVASLLLIVASLGAATAPPAAAQESEDPATSIEIDAENPALDMETTSEEASNLSALLIGAVLLGAGVWAYMNKKKRFPGARFRE